MKSRNILALAALTSLVLSGGVLAGNQVDSTTTINIGGTGAGLATMSLLAKAYQKTHPNIFIKVVPSLGSSGGIAALNQGALELSISARPLKDNELGSGAKATLYARTPFLFAVHKKVPKSDISTEELADIYGGRTAKWGDGTRIRLILRPMGDIDTATIRGLSPGLDLAVQQAHARPGMTIAVTDQECATALTQQPGALSASTLTEIVAENRQVTILSYNGVKPTLSNLSNGSYPLVKRLYLVTAAKTSAAALQFARFVRSPQARAILASTGNLPPADEKER
jgi:phosphate transport system substrate-binding protein